MMIERPNDRRGFVHKRIAGGIKGFVQSGFNPLAGVAGFLAPTESRTRRSAPRETTARPSQLSAAEKELGRVTKFPLVSVGKTGPAPFAGDGGCILPFRRDPRTGKCKIFLGEQSGRDDDLPATRDEIRDARRSGIDLTNVGEAVMGQFGAGMVPGNMVIDRAICLPGMQLGLDGLCYNKGAITNSQRRWPRGRRPLLTGGDMKAISRASRAGARLENAAGRLQDMGIIKKPIVRRRKKKSGAHSH